MMKFDIAYYFRAKNKYQSIPWRGYKTETPGLVVHRPAKCAGGDVVSDTRGWTISHLASGHELRSGTFIETKKRALRVAKELGGLADWTQDSSAISNNRDLYLATNKILAGHVY